MRRWNSAGAFFTPMGRTLQHNDPRGVGMAVKWWSSGCRGIW